MTNETTAILRNIRAKLNLTQEQLAERLGVSFATVNRWEGGTSKPQRAQAEAITALALEAGVEDEADAAGQRPNCHAARVAVVPAPTTKPMEQMLWDAACSIRGEKDAAKFKDYLLPLLFLKRLSDVFDDEITRVAEEYGNRKTALETQNPTIHFCASIFLPRRARASSAGAKPMEQAYA
jgi:type I restriction enzyme M protein